MAKSEGNIKCIPNNEEKYISFTKEIKVGRKNMQIRFIDSFRFMASSIDKLSKNLEREQFKNTNKIFKGDIDLITRKGVYPYEYMNKIEKFDEQQLPDKSKFYSTLTNTNISDDEYEHAKNVWNHYNIQNLGEYHDLYLRTDVMLLSDIFENFREVCMKNYKLDPAWYYTSPGLSWDALLKYTKIELDLLSDIDTVLFVEQGIRGGVSMISNRFSEANNKYMESYDDTKESTFITYLDANNLYGWAMCQKLPYSNFEWSNTNINPM